MKRAGFRKVYSLEGGIKAWHGILAEGPPDAAMNFFPPGSSSIEHLSLCWLLEEGTREFYLKASDSNADPDLSRLLGELSAAEEHHQKSLLNLFERMTGGASAELESLTSRLGNEAFMEGGMRVEDALGWAAGKGIVEVLELCVSLETNAYDRYLVMTREAVDESSKEVFRTISIEEKVHLERLTALLEARL